MKKSLLGLVLSLSLSNSFAAEIIVVAGDANTSTTGRWNYASSATMPYEGNRGMYALSSGISTYTFTPALPQTTDYIVEVYNSCYSPRSNQVIHTISHAEGTIDHVIEQDCQLDPHVGQWRTLGTYSFQAGNLGSVTINTSGKVANDNWQPYNGTGQLPGTLPAWDSNKVYVGLITYAYGNAGIPFMGVADSLSVETQ